MIAKQKTWKPVVGGVLSIVAGSFDLLGVLGIVIAIAVIGTPALFSESDIYPVTVGFISAILGALAVYLGVLGIFAIVGGVFATQRRKWGLALTGSIMAMLSSFVMGLLALIFIAMAKDEFNGADVQPKPSP